MNHKATFSRPVSEAAEPIPASIWLEKGLKGWELRWKWEDESRVKERLDDKRVLREFLRLPRFQETPNDHKRQVGSELAIERERRVAEDEAYKEAAKRDLTEAGEWAYAVEEDETYREEEDRRRREAQQEEEANRVLQFAETYGVLLLCKHSRPCHHSIDTGPFDSSESLGARAERCEPTQREPVWVWLKYVSQARAIATLANDLRGDGPGSEREWAILNLDGATFRRMGLERLRYFLGLKVSQWLRDGNVQLQTSWRGKAPSLELAGTGILGVIARQLAFAVTRVDGLVFCAGCGQPALPSRRPKPGQASWCEHCRQAGLARKAANRAYRVRKRDEGA